MDGPACFPAILCLVRTGSVTVIVHALVGMVRRVSYGCPVVFGTGPRHDRL